jgi:hypothetical protein
MNPQKRKTLILAVALGVVVFVGIQLVFQVAFGQSPSPSEIISKKYPTSVIVDYQSPNTVILDGYLIIKAGLLSNATAAELASYGNMFNRDLWAAMDLLKTGHGFQVQQIITSGVGSVGNPTTVYIVMAK